MSGDIFDNFAPCDHEYIGRVTSDRYDIGGLAPTNYPHASVCVCFRDACLGRAYRFVEDYTGGPGVFVAWHVDTPRIDGYTIHNVGLRTVVRQKEPAT